MNGKISSAEIYSSNGLFRKMWNKQLDAGAAEALSLKDAPGENAPKAEAVIAFLEDAEKGKPSVQNMAADTRLEVRHAPAAAMYEAQLAGRPSTAVHSEKRFFHRSYLRKD